MNGQQLRDYLALTGELEEIRNSPTRFTVFFGEAEEMKFYVPKFLRLYLDRPRDYEDLQDSDSGLKEKLSEASGLSWRGPLMIRLTRNIPVLLLQEDLGLAVVKSRPHKSVAQILKFSAPLLAAHGFFVVSLSPKVKETRAVHWIKNFAELTQAAAQAATHHSVELWPDWELIVDFLTFRGPKLEGEALSQLFQVGKELFLSLGASTGISRQSQISLSSPENPGGGESSDKAEGLHSSP